MTKYTVASSRRSSKTAEQPLPALWRGIGCLMIVFIPFVSYALAAGTVQFAVAEKWPMPYQMMGYPVMPADLMKVAGLSDVLGFIEAQQNLYAILLIAVLYILVLGGLLSVIYAFVYRYVGPPRYGPLDAPPPKVSVKRYKR